MDRIVLRTRLVPRAFPTVMGWTAQLLNERQKMELNPGPFGRGHKEPIFDVKNSESSHQVHKVCNGVNSRDYIGSERQKRRRTLMSAMNKAADGITELMRMMEENSEGVKDDECSKIAAKSSLKMLGVQ